MGQTHYPSKSWLFKNRFSFKVRQQGKQQLSLQYNVCWILYKMVGAPWLSQTYLYIQPPLESPSKIHSSTSANFHLPIFPLLVHEIILAIPTNTSILYASAIFLLPIFVYSHTYNCNTYNKNIFPTSAIGVFGGLTLF